MIYSIRKQINRQINLLKSLFFREASLMNDFLVVFFKEKNKKGKWTTEDKKLIREGLLHISCYIPVLIIFLLPFGSVLLPILVNIIDRRQNNRSEMEVK